jgi:hypothetical protein
VPRQAARAPRLWAYVVGILLQRVPLTTKAVGISKALDGRRLNTARHIATEEAPTYGR